MNKITVVVIDKNIVIVISIHLKQSCIIERYLLATIKPFQVLLNFRTILPQDDIDKVVLFSWGQLFVVPKVNRDETKMCCNSHAFIIVIVLMLAANVCNYMTITCYC